jgi:pristinamycin I synthase-3/4
MINEVLPIPGPIRQRQQKQAPLTYAQESLWFLQQLDPDSNAYNSTHLVKFTGVVDHTCMERAVNELIRRHEPLRAIYPNIGGRPLQVIQPYKHFDLPIIKLQDLGDEERQKTGSRYVAEHGDIPFNLQQGPLFRFALINHSTNEDELFFCTHHIGSDAWSWQVLLSDLLALYRFYHSDQGKGLPDLPIQYSDYALWQREWLSGETLAAYLTHWKKVLAGNLPVLDLPTDKPRPEKQSFRGTRLPFQFPLPLAAQAKEFCQRERVTPFHLFLAVYAVLLMRYTGQEDIIIGCPFANRPSLELNHLVGLFVNTLPIRVDLSGNPTFKELLKQVREMMLDAFSWQAAPFEALVSEISPERDLSRTPVFQVAINMRNVPKYTQDGDELMVEEILREDAPVPFDLSLEFNNSGDFFDVSFRYNIELFTRETITQMASHYQNLLREFITHGDDPIAAAEMHSPAEIKRLLGDWEQSRVDFPHTCIHELISRQARKNPHNDAVICNGRAMTYATLEKRSNQLAAYLQAKGVVRGSIVGILLPRSEDMLVTQLAILKTCAAYVYFDMIYPAERLSYMVRDSNPRVVVTLSSLEPKSLENFQKIFLDLAANEINAFPENADFASTEQEAPLYVTYTSGSTGFPKGVITLQRGVLNYIHYLRSEFNLHEGERILQSTSLAFDPSFRDTMGVLTFGGTVILMDDDQMRDPEFIARTIVEQKIDCIISIVPTLLRALTNTTMDKQIQENHLRLVMPSGEVLLPSDIESVRNTFGAAVQIVNQYGPTECSMVSTLYKVPDAANTKHPHVPIGKPIDNVYTYVLDPFLHLDPPGVKGELYIGGVGVSPGYLNQSELTSERFIPDPFRTGQRIYRTGDLVHRESDGNLSFLGRVDFQVKVHGYRIELGEIESVIRQFPNIREAVVVLFRQEQPEKLIAFVTLADTNSYFSTQDLLKYLKDRLAFYMLPFNIVLLSKMPLTPTGKIDRLGLPLERSRQVEGQFIAPRNDVEKRLVTIWQEVIGVDHVGVSDNYFALGGHSLMAVLLFTRIQEEFGKSIPMRLIFTDSTVEGLAAYLSEQPTSDG